FDGYKQPTRLPETLVGGKAETRKCRRESKTCRRGRKTKKNELVRPTTFMELLSHCHNLFLLGLKVASLSKSTQGSVNNPNKKLCPIRLRPWTECNAQQQDVYDRVCHYLQPTIEGEVAPHLFHSLNTIQENTPRYVGRPISSEKGLENYEKNCVEGHVGSVISELCQIPAAKTDQKSREPKPDHFCIREFDDGTNNLILVAEYKPPHKLSVENLRAGLQPMELYEQVVKRNTIPTEPTEKLQYNAEILTASALVQTYDAMIERVVNMVC
ncbi:uncharacterized protein N7483_009982, partial [Penicillium malachiteum]|uniref:uncharacterized protein n=1 Tax=Penicillium malachiteum TaxID=1324776 RepID=UPI002549152F